MFYSYVDSPIGRSWSRGRRNTPGCTTQRQNIRRVLERVRGDFGVRAHHRRSTSPTIAPNLNLAASNRIPETCLGCQPRDPLRRYSKLPRHPLKPSDRPRLYGRWLANGRNLARRRSWSSRRQRFAYRIWRRTVMKRWLLGAESTTVPTLL